MARPFYGQVALRDEELPFVSNSPRARAEPAVDVALKLVMVRRAHREGRC